MDEKITVFPGLSAPRGHHKTDPELIEQLECMLQEARDGTIISMAYAIVSNHELIKTSWVGKCNRSLIGYTIAKLYHEFFTDCEDDD
jgi:hypothetical protein